MWTQVRELTLGGSVEQGRPGQEHTLEEAVLMTLQGHNDEGLLEQRQGNGEKWTILR